MIKDSLREPRSKQAVRKFSIRVYCHSERHLPQNDNSRTVCTVRGCGLSSGESSISGYRNHKIAILGIISYKKLLTFLNGCANFPNRLFRNISLQSVRNTGGITVLTKVTFLKNSSLFILHSLR